MDLLDEIRREMLNMHHDCKEPNVVNLTVSQGFTLLVEFVDKNRDNPSADRVRQIIVNDDVDEMIEYINTGCHVFGMKVRVHKMVDVS